MEKSFVISNGALVPSENDNGNIIMYINPDANEKSIIQTKYDIDEHTIASSLDPDELSRIEIENGNIHMIWKYPRTFSNQVQPNFNVSSAGLFIFPDKLILVIEDETILFGHKYFNNIHSIIDFLMNFLYHTIRHYLDHLKVIKLISREVQNKINASMENEYLIQMFNLSECLVFYLNAISSNGIVLNKLRNYFEKNNLFPEKLDLLEDIIIENNQCNKQAEIYSQVFSGMMDARGSIVANNMNVLIKNLMIINIIFLPLNLIASIGGMSEFSMMTKGIDWRISYGLFGFTMILLGWFSALVITKLNLTSASTFRDLKLFRRRRKK